MLTKSNNINGKYSKLKVFYTLISTIFVIVIVHKSLFYPINFESTRYSYNSESDNLNKPLVLLESVPQVFEASISKINKDKVSSMEFSSTKDLEKIKGLKINLEESMFSLEVSGKKIYNKNFGEYDKIGVKYEVINNSLTIDINNKVIDKVKLESNITPSFTGYHLKTENILFRSTLETKNWKRNFGDDRYFLFFLLLILISIFIYSNDFRIRRGKISSITLGDCIVVLSLVVSGFISPPGFDDGEILSLIRNTNVFGYAASFSNGYPLGQWWFAANSYWFNNFDQIFLLRAPNLFIYLISWILIDRFIVKNIVQESKYRNTNLVNSIIFLVFSIAWAGTLRYDPPIILVLSAALIFFYKYLTERKLYYLFVVGVFMSISISTSISGFVIIPLGIFLIKAIIQNFNLQNIFVIYHTIILNLGFFVWLFFYNSNLSTWIMDLRATFGVGDHSILFLNEIERYNWIFNIWGSAARLSVIITGFVIIFALINVRRKNSNFELRNNEFITATLVLFSGLILTPSKFGWHFQVYLPLTLILSAFVLNEIDSSKYNLKKLSPIIAGSLIPVISGINIFGFTVTETYRTNGPINYYDKFFSLDHLSSHIKGLLIYFTLLIIIYLAFKLRESKKSKYFSIIIFIMILSIISPSFVYPILDAKDSINWNFTKQTISGLNSRAETCGVENSTSVISGLIQLPKKDNLSTDFKQASFSKIDLSNPIIRENLEDSQIFNYSIPNNSETVVFWLSGVTTPQDGSVLVSLFDGLKELSKTSLEANAQVIGDDWQIFELNTSIATSLRIEFNQKDPQISNWRIIHPGLPHFTKLEESFKSPTHSIGSYWANYLFFPCATLGVKNNGVKLVPEYQFGNIVSMRNESLYSAESELIPVGCLEMLNLQAKPQNCFYKVVYEGDGIWKDKISIKSY